MARFYGTIQGGRGEATRLGHSGLDVTAQSWQGDIVVSFSRADTKEEQRDWVTIRARGHGGTGPVGSVILYHGYVRDLLTPEGRNAIVMNFAEEMLRKAAENASARKVTGR